MIRICASALFMLLTLMAEGEVTVRIFSRTRPLTVVFTPAKGDYYLHFSKVDSIHVGVNEPVVFTRYADQVIFKMISGASQAADSVFILPASRDALFKLRAPARNEPVKLLDGSLKVKSYPGSLLVLNITDIESYLPGVVKAEAGSRGPDEYFRAQAVVARTYVYRNIDRHNLDGFNLCDDTHCQVYPGIINESNIVEACRSTSGQVVTDRDSVLIISAFHANCGGQTAASSDVWVSGQPYLVSVKDPYCIAAPSAKWERIITDSLWQGFLRSKGISPGQGSLLVTSTDEKQGERTSYCIIAGKQILKEEMRTVFSLRSSFFSLIPVGDSVIIKGRGYGHGVGLCQDGARVMASQGMTYIDITGFYFPGTIILDIKNAIRPQRP